MTSSGIISAATCCCSDPGCPTDYYTLWPVCGGIDHDHPCRRMLISDAFNEGFSNGDYIRPTSEFNQALRQVYKLGCSDNPPPECVGYGPDVQCQDPQDPTLVDTSAEDYVKCGSNNCGDCSNYPAFPSLPSCNDKFSYCAGAYSYDDSSPNNQDPFPGYCLRLRVDDVRLVISEDYYPHTTAQITNVSVIYHTGYDSSFGGVFFAGSVLRAHLLIEYSVTQERPECCDLPFPDNCNSPCCFFVPVGGETCTGGLHSLQVASRFGSGDHRVTAPYILGDNPWLEYGPTTRAPQCPDGGSGPNITTTGSQTLTQGLTDYPTACLPCSTFNFSGSLTVPLRLDGACETNSQTTNDSRFEIDFTVLSVAP